MALYKVIDKRAKKGTQPRLIKANSSSAALRHVAGTQFNVIVVTSAVMAGDLISSGIVMEIAGEPAFAEVEPQQEETPPDPAKAESIDVV